MDFRESTLWSLDRTRASLLRSLDGLTPAQVAHRACGNCNSIGSMVVHLGRVQDTWTTRIIGGKDIWETEGWDVKLGIPAADRGWTFDKQSMQEKKPLADLLAYYEAAYRRMAKTVKDLPVARFSEAVQSPMNLSVEQTFAHIIVEKSMHIGQIDYLKGMQKSQGL